MQDTQEIQRNTSSAKPQSETAESVEKIVSFALSEHENDLDIGNSCPYDTYHTPLWTFTRAVRSFYGEDVDPHEIFFKVESVIFRKGGWDILNTGLEPADIYFEFVCNWARVRYKIGETPLGNALEKAQAHPLQPERASRYRAFLARYSRFVSLAGWLQVAMGDRSILLPCEKIGELLGENKKTVSRLRQIAVQDGYLVEVRKHSFAGRRATEFRFDVSRFADLLEMAQAETADSFALVS